MPPHISQNLIQPKKNTNKGNAVCWWAHQDGIADEVEMFIMFEKIFFIVIILKSRERSRMQYLIRDTRRITLM